MTFNPEGIIKRTKGKMIMLYAVVKGEETHMASFFHDDKADFVIDAIIGEHSDITFTDEDKPQRAKKKVAQKKAASKKVASKKVMPKKSIKKKGKGK